MGKKRKYLEKNEMDALSESTKKLRNELVESLIQTRNYARLAFSDNSDSSDSESDHNSRPNVKKESDSSSDSSSSSDSERNTASENRNSEMKAVPVKNAQEQARPGASANQDSGSDSYHSDTEEEDKKRKKKQKQQLQLELNKKAKKGILIKRSEVRQEMRNEGPSDEDVQESQPGSSNDINDLPEWPQNDYAELIKRMELQLPEQDNLKFDSRASKLDWQKIAFSNYGPQECQDVWLGIAKRIRRYRILSEILQDAKEWVRQPWTNFYRGSKKNRHPDMPSRPLSTYMIYYLEHKDKVLSKNPGMDITQVSKIISEKYKILNPLEREKYAELAAQGRKAFEAKLLQFYKDHPDLIQSTKKPSAKEVSSKGPKKPSNPFKLYLEHQLKKKENKDKKVVEEEAKEKWKSLSDKKKALYINESLKDIKRFEKEIKEYCEKHPEYVPPAMKSVLSKEEKSIREKLAGKPVKPPNSAYSLYSRKMLQSDRDVKSLPPKERMAEISKKWKQLSESQKLKYEEEVRQLQDSYKLEFASYLEGLPQEDRERELNNTKKSTNKKKERAAPSAKKNTTGEKKNKTEKTDTTPANSEGTRSSASANRRKTVTFLEDSIVKKRSETEQNFVLFKGEPPPPPVKAFDLFLLSLKTNKVNLEKNKLKDALRAWEKLSDEQKHFYETELEEMKRQYVTDFENFLKGLSPELLKEFSRFKETYRDNRNSSINGNTPCSNEGSDEDSSSSDSDSSGSTVQSNKCSSSSEDDSDS